MSQVSNRGLANNAVDATKVKLANNTTLKARNAANSADVDIIKVNTSDRIEFPSFPQASGTPAAGNDLVNKTYVDGLTPSGVLLADGSVPLTGDLDADGFSIVNLVDPTNPQDASTKAYVDSVASAQKTWNKENITLNGTNITNQYVDLAHLIISGSLDLIAGGGLVQVEATDYTLSTVGGVTRVTFSGDLATGGPAALISGDIIRFKYQY